jgi:sialate O-acetylesterase
MIHATFSALLSPRWSVQVPSLRHPPNKSQQRNHSTLWCALLAAFLPLAPCASGEDLSDPGAGRAPKTHHQTSLPEIFSQNMILQREAVVPVWGDAPEGTVVSVSFNGQQFEDTARGGRWKVNLPPMPASADPKTLRVVASDGFKAEFTGILVGDVWLASGQSNMAMRLASAKGGREAVAASTNPLLRFYTVSTKLETVAPPVGDQWKVSGPDSAGSMSAVAYFFGEEIQRTQTIPVGLINCSYGGTVTETWCSPEVMAESWPDWERWSQAMRSDPKALVRNVNGSYLYTRMLKTVMPFPIKGFIWYQGEGNASRAEEQKRLLPAMIRDWRRTWQNDNLPFFFVQLARFEAADWHAFRCAQREVWARTPDTFMAVTIDLSKEAADHPIHPANKAPVGHRLALAARAKVYGETHLVYSGPVIARSEAQGQQARLSFEQVGSGLAALDGQPLRGFSLSADGKTFLPALAEIEGHTVVVSAPGVPQPIAVRYAAESDMGKATLDVNLGNREGLPASPFSVDLAP